MAGVWALCGLLLLDKWAVGEVGVSQPIVACPLLGWLMGMPGHGLALGSALQLVWVAALPLGKSRNVDYQGGGVAAIVGYRVLCGVVPDAGEGRLYFAALAIAFVGAVIGEILDSSLKRMNNRLFDAGIRARTPAATVCWHLVGIPASWARGAALAAVITGIGLGLARFVPSLPEFDRAEVLGVTLAIGVAGVVRMLVSLRRVPWFAAGGAAAGVLWLVTGR